MTRMDPTGRLQHLLSRQHQGEVFNPAERKEAEGLADPADLLMLFWWTDSAEPVDWRLDPAGFEFSATMTTVLYVKGEAVEGEGNLIYSIAFCQKFCWKGRRE